MIEVVVDDLAFVEADAILRPADDTLAPLTPAMKRLDLQAGARFAALCQVQSPLDAGAAVVTGGGDLSAPLVVHLVLQDADGSGRPRGDPSRASRRPGSRRPHGSWSASRRR